MNSVIQQLYMIPPIRNGILAIEGTGTDVDDDMSGDEKQENEVLCELLLQESFCPMKMFILSQHPVTDKMANSRLVGHVG